MTSAPAQRPPRSGWVWFAAVCAFALLLRLPVADMPLERDEGEYAYIGQQWLHGALPYRDSFDQKPPGVHFVYAAIETVAGTAPAAIHWATQIYSLATLAVIFVLGRYLSTPFGGVAAAAFAAFMSADPSVLGNAANTEVFMLLPLTAAMLAACYAAETDSLVWALATGVCAGTALLFKQVAIFNVLFYVLVVTWRSRRRACHALLVLLGVVSALLPAGAYFAVHGAWDDFFDATVGHNLRYASRQPLALYPRAFWLYFAPCLRSFWAILLLAGLAVARAVRKRAGRRARNTRMALAWLGASFLGTASGGFFRAHYFIQSIPPVAVLAGIAATTLAPRHLAAARRRAAGVALVAVPIAIGMQAYAWYWLPDNVDAKAMRIYGANAVAEARAVGRFIATHSAPQDRVFILGSEPQILYYAERKSASRYIFVYPLAGAYPDVRERQHAALREIALNRPRFIITVSEPGSFLADPAAPTDLTDTLADLVKQSYRLAAVTALTPEGERPLLTGERATEVWHAAPFTCCSLAVWERVADLTP